MNDLDFTCENEQKCSVAPRVQCFCGETVRATVARHAGICARKLVVVYIEDLPSSLSRNSINFACSH